MSNVELQLDLFEGQILTTEQENEIQEWIESQEKNAMERADYIKRLETTLKEAGFQKVQYVNDFTLVTKTNQERSFGYGDNRFTTEVSYVTYEGGIALKYNYFNSNEGKLASSTANVHLEKEWSRGAYRTKLQCGSITPMIVHHDGRFIPKVPKSGFDKILVDAPCTGSATTRKNPDVWKKWLPSGGKTLHKLQLELLVKAVNLTKPGGRIVYSTCSLDPIENEAVISEILKLDEGISLSPASKLLTKS